MITVYCRATEVTEAEIQAYYRRESDPHNPAAKFYTPQTVTVAALVTSVESRAHDAAKELAGGAPFAQVSSKFSANREAARTMNSVTVRSGQVRSGALSSLNNRIFQLKVGETLGPVSIGGKWWLIQCSSKAPAVNIPFNSVSGQCRIGAQLTKARATSAEQVEADFEAFVRAKPLLVLRPAYTTDVTSKKRSLLRHNP